MERQQRASVGDVVGSMFTAGALPAGLVAGLGDFFSPIGAWAAPLLAGMAALIVLLLFCAYRGLRHGVLQWIFKQERARLWARPFHLSPAFWSLLVFGLAGIIFGNVSRERREQGGWLASNVGAVSDLQRMTGIAEQSLQVQEGTLAGVRQLVVIGDTGTASNPRVTLANRGVDWTGLALDQALVNGDIETVQLFIQGGMEIDDSVDQSWDLVRFFRDYSPEVATVLVAQRDRIPGDACLPSGVGDSGSLRDWLTDDARLRLYARICDRPEVRKALKELARSEAQDAASVTRANARVGTDRRACKTRLRRELTIEKAIGLGFMPSINGNSTIDAPEERVAAGVHMVLNRPGTDDAAMHREYAALIDASCDESFEVQPVPAVEGVYERALDAF